MPAIIAEPIIENLRRFRPEEHSIKWQAEGISRACHLTKQLRPDGEGGYLRTVRKSTTYSRTTHHNYVNKPSNSYETSKVEDQSKSEGLTIEVKCPPQYRREYFPRSYDYTNDKLIVSPKPKLKEATPRSFLRIGKHQNIQPNTIAVNGTSIYNNSNPQDYGIRPFKMQKINPTSLVVSDETRYGKRCELVDNIKAKETSYEQFMTTEGNKRLRRRIFNSHQYQKTVTKTNMESSEENHSNLKCIQEVAKPVKICTENCQNDFQISRHVDNFCGSKHETMMKGQQRAQEDCQSPSILPAETEIPKDWHRHLTDGSNFSTNQLMTTDTRNISIFYNPSTHPNTKCELIRDLDSSDNLRHCILTPFEKSSSTTESKISSNSLFVRNRPTKYDDYSLSSLKKINHTEHTSSLPSYNVSPTIITIPETHLKHSNKSYQESERKLTVKSYSTVSSKSYKEAKMQTNHSPYTELRNLPENLPNTTLYKSNHDVSRRWQSKRNWTQQESSSEDSTRQCDVVGVSKKQNLSRYTNFSLNNSNSNPSNQQKMPLAYYSNGINSFRERSLTDEDRSVNEFLIQQSKQKEPPSQYYFGIPTARVRTKFKKDTDNITVSSPSLHPLSTEKSISENSSKESEDYRESWSGSEKHSSLSTLENSDDSSFFKETRCRKGPIEVCFSVRSHCQTKTIEEDPHGKELKKQKSQTATNVLTKNDEEFNRCEQKVFEESCSNRTDLWKKSLSAQENKREITFSRETKTSKEPIELRFSVKSFEQQRILRENTRNEQIIRPIEKLPATKNLERGKKPVEERIDATKENLSEREQHILGREAKRKKLSKDMTKKYPVEVRFSVKSCNKDKCEQINYKENITSERTAIDEINIECFGRNRKEKQCEEMFIRKVSNLTETTNLKNKLANSLNDLSIVSRQEQCEDVCPTVSLQSSLAEERITNKIIPSEYVLETSVTQREICNRKKDKFSSEVLTKTVDLKERDSSSRNFLNQTEAITQNHSLGNIKESFSTKFTVKRPTNELLQFKDEIKVHEVSQNASNSSINERFLESKSSPVKSQEVNIIKQFSPFIARNENASKRNTIETFKDISTLPKPRDYLENEMIIEYPKDSLKPNENFITKLPAQTKDGTAYAVTVPDAMPSLKSTSFVKQLLYYNTSNVELIPRSQLQEMKSTTDTMAGNKTTSTEKINNSPFSDKLNWCEQIQWIAKNQSESTDSKTAVHSSTSGFDGQETNVKKSDISLNIYPTHSNVEKETQRHLLSLLDTNSAFRRHAEKKSEETTHRCEYQLTLSDYGAVILNNQIPAVNRKTSVYYLQPNRSHRGYKLKNWKEEVIINRMFLDVKSVNKLKNDGMQISRKSNYLKIAPNDWTQSTDSSKTSENKNSADNETTPVSERTFLDSNSVSETGNIASSNTRDQSINAQKISFNKEKPTCIFLVQLPLHSHYNERKMYKKTFGGRQDDKLRNEKEITHFTSHTMYPILCTKVLSTLVNIVQEDYNLTTNYNAIRGFKQATDQLPNMSQTWKNKENKVLDQDFLYVDAAVSTVSALLKSDQSIDVHSASFNQNTLTPSLFSSTNLTQLSESASCRNILMLLNDAPLFNHVMKKDCKVVSKDSQINRSLTIPILINHQGNKQRTFKYVCPVIHPNSWSKEMTDFTNNRNISETNTIYIGKETDFGQSIPTPNENRKEIYHGHRILADNYLTKSCYEQCSPSKCSKVWDRTDFSILQQTFFFQDAVNNTHEFSNSNISEKCNKEENMDIISPTYGYMLLLLERVNLYESITTTKTYLENYIGKSYSSPKLNMCSILLEQFPTNCIILKNTLLKDSSTIILCPSCKLEKESNSLYEKFFTKSTNPLISSKHHKLISSQDFPRKQLLKRLPCNLSKSTSKLIKTDLLNNINIHKINAYNSAAVASTMISSNSSITSYCINFCKPLLNENDSEIHSIDFFNMSSAPSHCLTKCYINNDLLCQSSVEETVVFITRTITFPAFLRENTNNYDSSMEHYGISFTQYICDDNFSIKTLIMPSENQINSVKPRINFICRNHLIVHEMTVLTQMKLLPSNASYIRFAKREHCTDMCNCISNYKTLDIYSINLFAIPFPLQRHLLGCYIGSDLLCHYFVENIIPLTANKIFSIPFKQTTGKLDKWNEYSNNHSNKYVNISYLAKSFSVPYMCHLSASATSMELAEILIAQEKSAFTSKHEHSAIDSCIHFANRELCNEYFNSISCSEVTSDFPVNIFIADSSYIQHCCINNDPFFHCFVENAIAFTTKNFYFPICITKARNKIELKNKYCITVQTQYVYDNFTVKSPPALPPCHLQKTIFNMDFPNALIVQYKNEFVSNKVLSTSNFMDFARKKLCNDYKQSILCCQTLELEPINLIATFDISKTFISFDKTAKKIELRNDYFICHLNQHVCDNLLLKTNAEQYILPRCSMQVTFNRDLMNMLIVQNIFGNTSSKIILSSTSCIYFGNKLLHNDYNNSIIYYQVEEIKPIKMFIRSSPSQNQLLEIHNSDLFNHSFVEEIIIFTSKKVIVPVTSSRIIVKKFEFRNNYCSNLINQHMNDTFSIRPYAVLPEIPRNVPKSIYNFSDALSFDETSAFISNNIFSSCIFSLRSAEMKPVNNYCNSILYYQPLENDSITLFCTPSILQHNLLEVCICNDLFSHGFVEEAIGFTTNKIYSSIPFHKLTKQTNLRDDYFHVISNQYRSESFLVKNFALILAPSHKLERTCSMDLLNTLAIEQTCEFISDHAIHPTIHNIDSANIAFLHHYYNNAVRCQIPKIHPINLFTTPSFPRHHLLGIYIAKEVFYIDFIENITTFATSNILSPFSSSKSAKQSELRNDYFNSISSQLINDAFAINVFEIPTPLAQHTLKHLFSGNFLRTSIVEETCTSTSKNAFSSNISFGSLCNEKYNNSLNFQSFEIKAINLFSVLSTLYHSQDICIYSNVFCHGCVEDAIGLISDKIFSPISYQVLTNEFDLSNDYCNSISNQYISESFAVEMFEASLTCPHNFLKEIANVNLLNALIIAETNVFTSSTMFSPTIPLNCECRRQFSQCSKSVIHCKVSEIEPINFFSIHSFPRYLLKEVCISRDLCYPTFMENCIAFTTNDAPSIFSFSNTIRKTHLRNDYCNSLLNQHTYNIFPVEVFIVSSPPCLNSIRQIHDNDFLNTLVFNKTDALISINIFSSSISCTKYINRKISNDSCNNILWIPSLEYEPIKLFVIPSVSTHHELEICISKNTFYPSYAEDTIGIITNKTRSLVSFNDIINKVDLSDHYCYNVSKQNIYESFLFEMSTPLLASPKTYFKGMFKANFLNALIIEQRDAFITNNVILPTVPYMNVASVELYHHYFKSAIHYHLLEIHPIKIFNAPPLSLHYLLEICISSNLFYHDSIENSVSIASTLFSPILFREKAKKTTIRNDYSNGVSNYHIFETFPVSLFDIPSLPLHRMLTCLLSKNCLNTLAIEKNAFISSNVFNLNTCHKHSEKRVLCNAVLYCQLFKKEPINLFVIPTISHHLLEICICNDLFCCSFEDVTGFIKTKAFSPIYFSEVTNTIDVRYDYCSIVSNQYNAETIFAKTFSFAFPGNFILEKTFSTDLLNALIVEQTYSFISNEVFLFGILYAESTKRMFYHQRYNSELCCQHFEINPITLFFSLSHSKHHLLETSIPNDLYFHDFTESTATHTSSNILCPVLSNETNFNYCNSLLNHYIYQSFPVKNFIVSAPHLILSSSIVNRDFFNSLIIEKTVLFTSNHVFSPIITQNRYAKMHLSNNYFNSTRHYQPFKIEPINVFTIFSTSHHLLQICISNDLLYNGFVEDAIQFPANEVFSPISFNEITKKIYLRDDYLNTSSSQHIFECTSIHILGPLLLPPTNFLKGKFNADLAIALVIEDINTFIVCNMFLPIVYSGNLANIAICNNGNKSILHCQLSQIQPITTFTTFSVLHINLPEICNCNDFSDHYFIGNPISLIAINAFSPNSINETAKKSEIRNDYFNNILIHHIYNTSSIKIFIVPSLPPCIVLKSVLNRDFFNILAVEEKEIFICTTTFFSNTLHNHYVERSLCNDKCNITLHCQSFKLEPIDIFISPSTSLDLLEFCIYSDLFCHGCEDSAFTFITNKAFTPVCFSEVIIEIDLRTDYCSIVSNQHFSEAMRTFTVSLTSPHNFISTSTLSRNFLNTLIVEQTYSFISNDVFSSCISCITSAKKALCFPHYNNVILCQPLELDPINIFSSSHPRYRLVKTSVPYDLCCYDFAIGCVALTSSHKFNFFSLNETAIKYALANNYCNSLLNHCVYYSFAVRSFVMPFAPQSISLRSIINRDLLDSLIVDEICTFTSNKIFSSNVDNKHYRKRSLWNKYYNNIFYCQSFEMEPVNVFNIPPTSHHLLQICTSGDDFVEDNIRFIVNETFSTVPFNEVTKKIDPSNNYYSGVSNKYTFESSVKMFTTLLVPPNNFLNGIFNKDLSNALIVENTDTFVVNNIFSQVIPCVNFAHASFCYNFYKTVMDCQLLDFQSINIFTVTSLPQYHLFEICISNNFFYHGFIENPTSFIAINIFSPILFNEIRKSIELRTDYSNNISNDHIYEACSVKIFEASSPFLHTAMKLLFSRNFLNTLIIEENCALTSNNVFCSNIPRKHYVKRVLCNNKYRNILYCRSFKIESINIFVNSSVSHRLLETSICSDLLYHGFEDDAIGFTTKKVFSHTSFNDVKKEICLKNNRCSVFPKQETFAASPGPACSCVLTTVFSREILNALIIELTYSFVSHNIFFSDVLCVNCVNKSLCNQYYDSVTCCQLSEIDSINAFSLPSRLQYHLFDISLPNDLYCHDFVESTTAFISSNICYPVYLNETIKKCTLDHCNSLLNHNICHTFPIKNFTIPSVPQSILSSSVVNRDFFNPLLTEETVSFTSNNAFSPIITHNHHAKMHLSNNYCNSIAHCQSFKTESFSVFTVSFASHHLLQICISNDLLYNGFVEDSIQFSANKIFSSISFSEVTKKIDLGTDYCNSVLKQHISEHFSTQIFLPLLVPRNHFLKGIYNMDLMNALVIENIDILIGYNIFSSIVASMNSEKIALCDDRNKTINHYQVFHLQPVNIFRMPSLSQHNLWETCISNDLFYHNFIENTILFNTAKIFWSISLSKVRMKIILTNNYCNIISSQHNLESFSIKTFALVTPHYFLKSVFNMDFLIALSIDETYTLISTNIFLPIVPTMKSANMALCFSCCNSVMYYQVSMANSISLFNTFYPRQHQLFEVFTSNDLFYHSFVDDTISFIIIKTLFPFSLKYTTKETKLNNNYCIVHLNQLIPGNFSVKMFIAPSTTPYHLSEYKLCNDFCNMLTMNETTAFTSLKDFSLCVSCTHCTKAGFCNDYCNSILHLQILKIDSINFFDTCCPSSEHLLEVSICSDLIYPNSIENTTEFSNVLNFLCCKEYATKTDVRNYYCYSHSNQHILSISMFVLPSSLSHNFSKIVFSTDLLNTIMIKEAYTFVSCNVFSSSVLSICSVNRVCCQDDYNSIMNCQVSQTDSISLFASSFSSHLDLLKIYIPNDLLCHDFVESVLGFSRVVVLSPITFTKKESKIHLRLDYCNVFSHEDTPASLSFQTFIFPFVSPCNPLKISFNCDLLSVLISEKTNAFVSNSIFSPYFICLHSAKAELHNDYCNSVSYFESLELEPINLFVRHFSLVPQVMKTCIYNDLSYCCFAEENTGFITNQPFNRIAGDKIINIVDCWNHCYLSIQHICDNASVKIFVAPFTLPHPLPKTIFNSDFFNMKLIEEMCAFVSNNIFSSTIPYICGAKYELTDEYYNSVICCEISQDDLMHLFDIASPSHHHLLDICINSDLFRFYLFDNTVKFFTNTVFQHISFNEITNEIVLRNDYCNSYLNQHICDIFFSNRFAVPSLSREQLLKITFCRDFVNTLTIQETIGTTCNEVFLSLVPCRRFAKWQLCSDYLNCIFYCQTLESTVHFATNCPSQHRLLQACVCGDQLYQQFVEDCVTSTIKKIYSPMFFKEAMEKTDLRYHYCHNISNQNISDKLCIKMCIPPSSSLIQRQRNSDILAIPEKNLLSKDVFVPGVLCMHPRKEFYDEYRSRVTNYHIYRLYATYLSVSRSSSTAPHRLLQNIFSSHFFHSKYNCLPCETNYIRSNEILQSSWFLRKLFAPSKSVTFYQIGSHIIVTTSSLREIPFYHLPLLLHNISLHSLSRKKSYDNWFYCSIIDVPFNIYEKNTELCVILNHCVKEISGRQSLMLCFIPCHTFASGDIAKDSLNQISENLRDTACIYNAANQGEHFLRLCTSSLTEIVTFITRINVYPNIEGSLKCLICMSDVSQIMMIEGVSQDCFNNELFTRNIPEIEMMTLKTDTIDTNILSLVNLLQSCSTVSDLIVPGCRKNIERYLRFCKKSTQEKNIADRLICYNQLSSNESLPNSNLYFLDYLSDNNNDVQVFTNAKLLRPNVQDICGQSVLLNLNINVQDEFVFSSSSVPKIENAIEAYHLTRFRSRDSYSRNKESRLCKVLLHASIFTPIDNLTKERKMYRYNLIRKTISTTTDPISYYITSGISQKIRKRMFNKTFSPKTFSDAVLRFYFLSPGGYDDSTSVINYWKDLRTLREIKTTSFHEPFSCLSDGRNKLAITYNLFRNINLVNYKQTVDNIRGSRSFIVCSVPVVNTKNTKYNIDKRQIRNTSLTCFGAHKMSPSAKDIQLGSSSKDSLYSNFNISQRGCYLKARPFCEQSHPQFQPNFPMSFNCYGAFSLNNTSDHSSIHRKTQFKDFNRHELICNYKSKNVYPIEIISPDSILSFYFTYPGYYDDVLSGIQSKHALIGEPSNSNDCRNNIRDTMLKSVWIDRNKWYSESQNENVCGKLQISNGKDNLNSFLFLENSSASRYDKEYYVHNVNVLKDCLVKGNDNYRTEDRKTVLDSKESGVMAYKFNTISSVFGKTFQQSVIHKNISNEDTMRYSRNLSQFQLTTADNLKLRNEKVKRTMVEETNLISRNKDQSRNDILVFYMNDYYSRILKRHAISLKRQVMLQKKQNRSLSVVSTSGVQSRRYVLNKALQDQSPKRAICKEPYKNSNYCASKKDFQRPDTKLTRETLQITITKEKQMTHSRNEGNHTSKYARINGKFDGVQRILRKNIKPTCNVEPNVCLRFTTDQKFNSIKTFTLEHENSHRSAKKPSELKSILQMPLLQNTTQKYNLGSKIVAKDGSSNKRDIILTFYFHTEYLQGYLLSKMQQEGRAEITKELQNVNTTSDENITITIKEGKPLPKRTEEINEEDDPNDVIKVKPSFTLFVKNNKNEDKQTQFVVHKNMPDSKATSGVIPLNEKIKTFQKTMHRHGINLDVEENIPLTTILQNETRTIDEAVTTKQMEERTISSQKRFKWLRKYYRFEKTNIKTNTASSPITSSNGGLSCQMENKRLTNEKSNTQKTSSTSRLLRLKCPKPYEKSKSCENNLRLRPMDKEMNHDGSKANVHYVYETSV